MTGAELYFAEQHENPEYHAAYIQARAEVDALEEVLKQLELQQQHQDLSEIAKRAGISRREMRRVVSPVHRGPRFETVTAVAAALGLTIRIEPSTEGTVAVT